MILPIKKEIEIEDFEPLTQACLPTSIDKVDIFLQRKNDKHRRFRRHFRRTFVR